MSARQEAAVRRWYKIGANRERDRWNFIPKVGDVSGLQFGSTTIEDSQGNQLAVMVRGAHTVPFESMVPFDFLPPLVLLRLPNPRSIARYRLIARVVEEEGGQTLTVPQRLLVAADIHAPSVFVLDTQKRPPVFRAPHQLIRAKVMPVFIRARPRFSYFLTGYDLNEPGLSYFFCELPPGASPATIEEAYQALKPRSVVLAEQRGLSVERQGDLFFIPTRKPPTFETFDAFDSTAYNVHDYVSLHGTNHFAKIVATQGTLTYVMGTVVHRPTGRSRDHHPLHLGFRHWWLCVRNTVPVVG